MTTQTFNTISEHLVKQINDDFQVKACAVSTEAYTPQERPVVETVIRNPSAPLIVTYDALVFPVRSNGQLVGATLVRGIRSLHPKQISQIKDLIDSYFRKKAMELQNSAQSNVIPLFA